MDKKTYRRIHAVQDAPLKNIRLSKKSDAPAIRDLMNKYLERCKVRQIWTKKEVEHFLLNTEDVVYSYVVENNDKELVGFFSFYSLPSSCLKSDKHSHVYKAYNWYSCYDDKSITLADLMNSTIFMAKELKFDVFNTLDVMENSTV